MTMIEDWKRTGEALVTGRRSLLELIAEAACLHPDDSWVARAKVLIPNLEQYYTPPCQWDFDEPARCDDRHAHGLMCGRPEAICKRCGRTNAKHREERERCKRGE